MFPSCITHIEYAAFLLIVIQEDGLLTILVLEVTAINAGEGLLVNLRRLSQASVRQFLFQRTQIAVLLAQGCHVARPRLTLTELLIQGAHPYQIGAG